MEKNRIKLNICGTDYILSSEDDVEYMISVGQEVEKQMKSIIDSNPRISMMMASVLTSITFCDKARKLMRGVDKMRENMQTYLEEETRSKIELDEANRAIARMNIEIQTLKSRLEVYSRENPVSDDAFSPADRRNYGGYENANDAYERDTYSAESDSAKDLLQFFIKND